MRPDPTHEVSLEEAIDAWQAQVWAGHGSCLLGAGVSMLPPSSLDSGNRLRDRALDWLLGDSQWSNEWRVLRGDRRYQELLPEVVFEQAFAMVHEEVLGVFEALVNAPPNPLHSALARLATDAEMRILTTNFDDLLESAGADSSLVTHLHGHLAEPTSLVFRVAQSGLPVAQINQLVARAATDRLVAILGYSGRDPDILAALHDARPSGVVWLARVPVERSVREAARQLELVCTVTLVVADLADVAPLIDRATGARRNVERQHSAPPRGAVISDDERAALLARLWDWIGEPRRSLAVHKRALRSSKGSKMRSWFGREAALCAMAIGHGAEAEVLAAAAGIDARGGTLYARAAVENVIGLVAIERGAESYQAAAVAFEAALELLDRFEAGKGPNVDALRQQAGELRGSIANNLGWLSSLRGDFATAVSYYRASRDIKRKVGFVSGMAHSAANLAVAYRALGQEGPSARWRREADRAFAALGMIDARVRLHRELAEEARVAGRKVASRRSLTTAMRLSAELPPGHIERSHVEKAFAAWGDSTPGTPPA